MSDRTIGTFSSSGLNLESGESLQIGGTQVVTSQQGAIPNDVSGAPNEATVNAILAALRQHGLIAG